MNETQIRPGAPLMTIDDLYALARKVVRKYDVPGQGEDDLVQVAAITGWDLLQKTDPNREDLVKFLRRKMKLRLRRELYKTKKRIPFGEVEYAPELPNSPPSPRGDGYPPDIRIVRELCSYLTPRQAAVFERFYWHQMTAKQIAAGLGTTEKAVTRLLEKGRVTLRRIWGEKPIARY